jgi:hypothetical protein
MPATYVAGYEYFFPQGKKPFAAQFNVMSGVRSKSCDHTAFLPIDYMYTAGTEGAQKW